MILFVFWLALFNWSAGQVEYVWVFHSILWIVRQDLSCYIFYFVYQVFVLSYPDFLELTFSMTYLTKKMTSELTYRTLNFMNIYLSKVNSVHLTSAKHICPNFWLLESWVFDFEYYFSDLFRLCPPPILHVHLGDANNMRPLNGWGQNGKQPNFGKPY